MFGLGYTYAGRLDRLELIGASWRETIAGLDAMDPQAAWRAMQRAVRNLGREGLAATAISAVDAALYDLKARLLDVPLATLLGAYRDSDPDLRQRRFHHLFRRRTRKASLAVGCRATAARSSR